MNKPPKHLLRFFRWFCHLDYAEDIEGDLHEEFYKNIEKYGLKMARRKFTWAVLTLFRPSLMKNLESPFLQNVTIMFRHNFKVSLRILFKYRLYTGISLIGLSIAIASFWFIANFVKNAYQYDTLQQHVSSIYRLTMQIKAGDNTEHYATTGKPLGSFLKTDYPDITAYAKLTPYGNTVVKIKDNFFKEKDIFSANPEALEVFTFDFLTQSKTKVDFSQPNSILLSRNLAEKYFKSTDIVDKTIMIGDADYAIKGVFENWPANAHLHPNALIYSAMDANYELQDWFDLEHYNYVLLAPTTKQKDLENSLAQLKAKYLTADLADSGVEVAFQSQPLDGLYFEPALINDIPKGTLKYINALGLAGLFVLLIAGLNYMNLSLTQSTKRSKEIQLKKMLGISRKQLLYLNGMESWMMTLFVLVIAGILIFSFDDLYFQYAGFYTLYQFNNWPILLGLLLLIFVFGLIGSSYSSVYLSYSSKLIPNRNKSINTFKKALLGFQFVIAAVIIIATVTMNEQIHFMKNKDLGFSKEEVLIVNLPDNEELKNKYIQFREKVKNFASVENASLIGGGALPGEDNGKELFQVTVDGNKVEKVYNIYRIDENYCNLLGINFALGRNFESNRLSDKKNGVIINQSLAKSLKWENPLGQTIWYGDQPRAVIGVIQNFHNKSLHNLIEPIVFLYDEDFSNNLLIKTQPINVDRIKAIWVDYFPETPFALSYFDQFIAKMYTKEDDLSRLLGFFSAIALGLCCMGLFAIFSLHLLQKTKELSIRKILGATTMNLIKTITKKYVTIILLAIIIAIPIAEGAMRNWLNEFSYKIEMNIFIFILSTFLILLMSGFTLLYHIIKSLKINPVEALKSE